EDIRQRSIRGEVLDVLPYPAHMRLRREELPELMPEDAWANECAAEINGGFNAYLAQVKNISRRAEGSFRNNDEKSFGRAEAERQDTHDRFVRLTVGTLEKMLRGSQ